MAKFEIDVNTILANSVHILDETEYKGIYIRVGTESENYINGISVERGYGNENSFYYGLYYNYEEKKYYLLRFVVSKGENNSINRMNYEIVASFSMNDKQLEFDEEIIASINNDNRYGWTNNNIVISKFITMILNNHPNSIAGQKVLVLMRRKCSSLNQYAFCNILNYYDHIQSIEKLGESFIQSIGTADFTINTAARDRSKTLALPKQVVDYIENLDETRRYGNYKTEYLQAFQSIMDDDANEIIAIIDYFNLYKKVSKKIPNQNGASWRGAATPGDDLALLREFGRIRYLIPDLDLRRVLNYLVKQQFLQIFAVNYGNPRFDPIRFAITIPSRLARIYADYLAMKPIEVFPQDLYKSHNVLAMECKIKPTDEEMQKFKAYGDLLGKAYNKTIKDYTFVVPNDYQEFIRIGKTFMNCLPTCGKAFYSGMCDIVFIYKDGEDTPKYALELDAYKDVVQAKTTRDLDISDEAVLVAIDAYVDVLRKEATA